MPKVLDSPRQRILENARQLLMEYGYEEFSIREVAKSCGLAVGTIYNYFSTKHDLVVQIMLEHWENYLRMVDEIGREDEGLFVKLRKTFEQLELFIGTFHGVWIKANIDTREFHTKEKLQKHKDFIDRLACVLTELIEREVKNNADLQLPVDTQSFARFIIQNFLIISQMHQFEYAEFEKILKKLVLK